MLAPGEYRKIIAIMVLCFAVAHARRKEAKKRWMKSKSDDKEDRVEDHPFLPYLIENAFLFGGPVLFTKIGVIDPDRPAATFLTLVGRGGLIVTSGLMYQQFWADSLYKHVPYFTTTRPSNTFMDIFQDYLRCNFVVDLVLASLQVYLMRYVISRKEFDESRLRLVKVFPFLGKLFLARIVNDVAFYILHWLLHTEVGYKYIHYRHHEHTSPRLQTNYHFVALDLFLEAVAPVLIAAVALKNLGIHLSSYERDAILLSSFYYDAGSHMGKEVPIVTFFPPLSPVMDALTGCDQRLIEYHTRHHQLFNCNYSISPWLDKLVGTYQMEYQVKDKKIERS